MAWKTSTKFRFNQKWMSKHLTQQEILWRERINARAKVYTPEEILAYAEARGLSVAPEVLAATRGTP